MGSVKTEVATQWAEYSENNPEEARKLKIRLGKTGAGKSVGNVLNKIVARDSQIATAGTDEHNESQWKDRMTARGATPDQAQACWDCCRDMAGTKYSKQLFIKKQTPKTDFFSS